MKSIHVFLNRFFVAGVHTERPFPLFNLEKIITLESNTDVNKVIAIPIISVNAKPLIGPVPKKNNTTAVKKVVV